ncbi:MAG TPA: hypothetical protein PLD82_08025 [Spirochaetota bacterium]|nr:hypothetical protein [Spirochaetota bacterium]
MEPDRALQGQALTPETFLQMLDCKAADLVLLCRHILKLQNVESVLQRPLLGRLFIEASKIEEVLDAYGAKNSKHWCRFRSLVAALKTFSNATYVFLHIRNAAPRYRLLPIEGDFFSDTGRCTTRLGAMLVSIVRTFVSEARRTGMAVRGRFRQASPLYDMPLTGILPADRQLQHIASPAKVVVYLATAFLSESGQSLLQDLAGKLDRCRYAECVPDMFSERSLRVAEREFHNLQAMYDTHISDTDAEQQDRNLPVIRGHVSIIYHLLEIATLLSHHYERHIAGHGSGRSRTRPIVNVEELLEILIEYSLAYAGKFMKSAQHLCRAMIRRYAEPARIEVPVPVYRGFHVRPSTLVAKIVLHYGSEVYLETTDGSRYDASSPLELFRVNEKINAEKRRMLAQHMAALPEIKQAAEESSAKQELMRRIFFRLLQKKDIVIYEGHLPFDDIKPEDGEILPEFLKRALAYFLAHGLIDIRIDMQVAFCGDRRVLDDIRVLAEHGYGEDRYGNDVMLPPPLAYLKR